MKQNTVHCVSALDSSVKYPVPYDVLVIGVGAMPNTFGIPGVQEYAFFLKVKNDLFVLGICCNRCVYC